MKVLSAFAAAFFFPFDFLGAVIVWTFTALRHFIRLFFLSPWGLLLPLTLIAFFILFELSGRLSDGIVRRYETELASCEESKISAVLDILVRLEDKGIPPLVRCLGSQREAVFVQGKKTLQKELERWNTLPSEEHAKKYRIFSENLSKFVTNLPPVGQIAAIDFAQKILSELVTNQNHTVSDFHWATQNCEQVLEKMETVRKKKITPLKPSDEQETDSLAYSRRKPFDSVLMANASTPFEPAVPYNNDVPDAFAASRPEVLYAYHQSPNFSLQKQIPPRAEENVEEYSPKTPSEFDTTELAAAPVQAVINGKISDNYIQRHKNPDTVSEFNSVTRTSQDIPLSGVADLSSEQLMQFLHHPDSDYVAEARKTLVGRDGFQEPHLKLAYRLFHPDTSVREGVLTLLPTVAGTQPNVWLSVLLNDPDNDIRYRAASMLATTDDPSVLRLVIDKAKRDSDARIVKIAEQLLEQQGSRIRR